MIVSKFQKNVLAVLGSGIVINLSMLLVMKLTQLGVIQGNFSELTLFLRYANASHIIMLCGASIVLTQSCALENDFYTQVAMLILLMFISIFILLLLIVIIPYITMVEFSPLMRVYGSLLALDTLIYSVFRGQGRDQDYLIKQRIVVYVVPLFSLLIVDTWQSYLLIQCLFSLVSSTYFVFVLMRGLKLGLIFVKICRLSHLDLIKKLLSRFPLDVSYMLMLALPVFVTDFVWGSDRAARLSIMITFIAASNYFLSSIGTVNLARYTKNRQLSLLVHDLKGSVFVVVGNIIFVPIVVISGAYFFSLQFQSADILLILSAYLWGIFVTIRPFLEAGQRPLQNASVILGSLLFSTAIFFLIKSPELFVFMSLLIIILIQIKWQIIKS